MKKVVNLLVMFLVSFLIVSGFSFADNSPHNNKKQNQIAAVSQDSTIYGKSNNGSNMDTTYNRGRTSRTDTGYYNNGNNGTYNNGNNGTHNNGSMNETTHTH